MPRPYWWVVGGRVSEYSEYSEYSNTKSYPLTVHSLTRSPLTRSPSL